MKIESLTKEQKPEIVEYHPDHNLKIMVELGSNGEEETYRLDSIHIFGEDITELFNTITYFCEDDLNQHIKDVFKQLNN